MKIGDLIPIGAVGNAVASDVLQGKTFSSSSGTDLTGTMLNNGMLSKTITTQGGKQIITPGYYEGGEVQAQFNNLVPENIKTGVNIGGIVGIYSDEPMASIVGNIDNKRVISKKNSVGIGDYNEYNNKVVYPGYEKVVKNYATFIIGISGEFLFILKGYRINAIKFYLSLVNIYVNDKLVVKEYKGENEDKTEVPFSAKKNDIVRAEVVVRGYEKLTFGSNYEIKSCNLEYYVPNYKTTQFI